MKKSEKLLFFYSIIAVTVVFLASAFFSPTPLNLILGITLVPIVFYFWIRMTSPADVDVSMWSIRLVVAVVGLCALGVLTYYLSIQGSSSFANKQSENQDITEKIEGLSEKIESLGGDDAASDKILKEMTIIREELARLKRGESTLGTSDKDNDLSEILLEYEEDSVVNKPLGYIAVIDSADTFINTHTEPNNSSKVAGQIVHDQDYPYYEVQGGWYQIKLSEDSRAWVNAVDVKLVNNN